MFFFGVGGCWAWTFPATPPLFASIFKKVSMQIFLTALDLFGERHKKKRGAKTGVKGREEKKALGREREREKRERKDERDLERMRDRGKGKRKQ